MKSIAVVLILFGFVATGIGVYFIRQSQVTSSQSKAYDEVKPLPRILGSDCDYEYGEKCKLKVNGDSLQSVPLEIQKVLREHASPLVLKYTEPVDSKIFESLGAPSDLPEKALYTIPEIIARVSFSSNINYKLLLAVFATQGEKAWNGDVPLSNPFGRREFTFTEQLVEVARGLKSSYQGTFAIPKNFVTNRTTTYELDVTQMNTASRSLYVYFSNTLTEDEFKRLVVPGASEDKSFQDTWYKLFPEDAVRK